MYVEITSHLLVERTSSPAKNLSAATKNRRSHFERYGASQNFVNQCGHTLQKCPKNEGVTWGFDCCGLLHNYNFAVSVFIKTRASYL
jgi:hypothetical protein